MQGRICPHCFTRWYSSDSSSVWKCESCGHEIPVLNDNSPIGGNSKMKELKAQVLKLAEEEAERSMIKHPLFNSTHEGYAVIKEEIEEAAEELAHVISNLNKMWWQIRADNKEPSIKSANNIKIYAIDLAAESIQVAAMAQKFADSFKEDEMNE